MLFSPPKQQQKVFSLFGLLDLHTLQFIFELKHHALGG